MSSKVYVGNLPFSVDEAELTSLMGECGTVVSVHMPTDRETGRKRGFAFVELETAEQAEAAIAKFDGYTMGTRPITVNIAREKPKGGGGGGGGGRW